MIKYALGFVVSGTVVFLARAIYKEITFLHRVAIDTMDVNNKLEILYSKMMQILLDAGYTDRQKLQRICYTLITGFRPNFVAC